MLMIIHHDSLTVSIKGCCIIIISIVVGSYRKTIPESVTIGSSLLNVTATDDDIAPNNMICYSILAEVSGALM